MKSRKRVLPALMLSLFAGLAAPAAQSAQFSGVYVFGDSLSDAGYFRGFLASLGLPAPLVATMGRYTTNPGPVWSELVTSYYGFTPAPSNDGGDIFAQGGARVTGVPGVSTPPGQAQRPISVQVDEFLARGEVDPDALYAMWAGANDLFFNLGAFQAGAIDAATLQANVLGAAQAEIAQIGRLQAAGARYILVFGLPNVGATPAFATNPASGSVTALSAGYNTTLFTGLQAAGIRVIPVDTFSLFNEILADPARFGFTNSTAIACGAFPPITTAQTANSLFCHTGNLNAAGAQNSFVFADSVHPTSASHRITADFVQSLIEGPSQYGLLAESALRAREAHIRVIGDGIASARRNEVGGIGVFVAGNAANADIESDIGLVGMDSRTTGGIIGLTARASDAVMLGIAYGQGRNKGYFGQEAGSFESRERVFSAFGSLRLGGFYGTGVVSVADVDYDHLERRFNIGPDRRIAEANTDGSNSSAHFTVGYDFPLGRFTVGPTVAVTTQSVEVNGFDETGAGAAGLRLHTQTRKSEVWSVGARASIDLGMWTPWIRVTADKERRNDARDVTATPLTMVPIGTVYAVPTFRPDDKYVTASLGVNGLVLPNVALGLAYYRVDSRSGMDEDGFHGTVSVRF